MIKKLLLFIFLLTSSSQFAIGQEVLDYPTYLGWVKAYHPMAKRAELQVRKGEERMKAASGLFDPVIVGDWYQKEYNDDLYYRQQSAGIRVPTILGVEFSGNYDVNSGIYLNPELTVPDNGLLSAGVAINLGQGLLIDKQRAERRKAQIFVEATKNRQLIMLNNLYLDASIAYWTWAAVNNEVKIIENALSITEERFQAIKDAWQGGELPAIDTVEGFSQLQLLNYRLEEANRKLFEQRMKLSVFLWDENEVPIIPAETTVPTDIQSNENTNIDFGNLLGFVDAHPALKEINFTLASLNVERRLQAEYLRPKLALKYNLLQRGPPGSEALQLNPNNYTFGASFAFPIFARTARGNLQLAKIDIFETELGLDLTKQRLIASLNEAYNSLLQYREQLVIYGKNLNALQALLEGEKTRFEIGESSLFLVNARENAVVQAELIYNTLLLKQNIGISKTNWAAGIGFNE